MGVGGKTIISDHDLAFVGNMGSHQDDELQIIHRLLVAGGTAISISHLALRIQEGKPFQGEKRWDHFVRHLLGAEPPKEYQIRPGGPQGR